ncbi:hypothetical protein [Sphingosinicella terrae]|uniref:hypothetical protein n=1 Tax=Sphingosinicella terrae TaxID=2172047 RepID=UPI0013B46F96|nr:hypothetical protein [Sphingosinicella terrae]
MERPGFFPRTVQDQDAVPLIGRAAPARPQPTARRQRIPVRKLLLASLLIMSAACASPHDRWYRLHADPGLLAWTACIDDRSGRWAAHFTGMQRDEAMDAHLTSNQAFATILDRCAEHARAPSWDELGHERRQRLSQAARWRFDALEKDALARLAEGVI